MAKEEKKGFFTRLKEGLAKTRANITDNMDMVFASYDKVTDEFLEELEETMIMGDIGVKTTEELLDHLRRQVKEEKIRWAADCRQELLLAIRNQMKQGKDAYDFEKGPAVILVIGVNGVGKTTSIGKLAANLPVWSLTRSTPPKPERQTCSSAIRQAGSIIRRT